MSRLFTDAETDKHVHANTHVPVLCLLYGSTHAHTGERYHVCRSDVPESLFAPPSERVGGLHTHTHSSYDNRRGREGERGERELETLCVCVCVCERERERTRQVVT